MWKLEVFNPYEMQCVSVTAVYMWMCGVEYAPKNFYNISLLQCPSFNWEPKAECRTLCVPKYIQNSALPWMDVYAHLHSRKFFPINFSLSLSSSLPATILLWLCTCLLLSVRHSNQPYRADSGSEATSRISSRAERASLKSPGGINGLSFTASLHRDMYAHTLVTVLIRICTINCIPLLLLTLPESM